jgi:hypothetical protein
MSTGWQTIYSMQPVRQPAAIWHAVSERTVLSPDKSVLMEAGSSSLLSEDGRRFIESEVGSLLIDRRDTILFLWTSAPECEFDMGVELYFQDENHMLPELVLLIVNPHNVDFGPLKRTQ